MAVVPIGNFSLTQRNLQILVADSASFRTATGTATRAAAMSFVYLASTDPEKLVDRATKTFRKRNKKWALPASFAVVRMGQGWSETRDGSGPNGFFPSYPLQLQLFRDDDKALSAEDRQFSAGNWVDSVVRDMQALAGGQDGSGDYYLEATSFTLSDFFLTDPAERYSYYFFQYDVQVW